jgi:hypothetical protein
MYQQILEDFYSYRIAENNGWGMFGSQAVALEHSA